MLSSEEKQKVKSVLIDIFSAMRWISSAAVWVSKVYLGIEMFDEEIAARCAVLVSVVTAVQPPAVSVSNLG